MSTTFNKTKSIIEFRTFTKYLVTHLAHISEHHQYFGGSLILIQYNRTLKIQSFIVRKCTNINPTSKSVIITKTITINSELNIDY